MARLCPIEKLKSRAKLADHYSPADCLLVIQRLDRDTKAEEQKRRAGMQPI